MLLLNASGCLDALAAPEVARVARCVRHEDRHARAARAATRRCGSPRPTRECSTRSASRTPGGSAFLAGRCPRCAGSASRSGSPSGASPPREYAETCAALDDVTIELNLSCPNVDEAPESAAEIVAACRASDDASALREALAGDAWDIGELARAVEAAGADGLSLVNTIRGLALDERLRPRLARATGGYSGPALKPIALAAVYACRRATELPIVGMGGVRTGRDVLEFVACGATHVALGTALFADPDAAGSSPQRAGS